MEKARPSSSASEAKIILTPHGWRSWKEPRTRAGELLVGRENHQTIRVVHWCISMDLHNSTATTRALQTLRLSMDRYGPLPKRLSNQFSRPWARSTVVKRLAITSSPPVTLALAVLVKTQGAIKKRSSKVLSQFGIAELMGFGLNSIVVHPTYILR